MAQLMWGDPFYLGVNEDNTAGTLYDFAVDCHPGAFATEAEAIAESAERVDEYRNRTIVYWCVPVLRIDPVPQHAVTRLNAQGMSAGTAETAQQAQGEARQPGPKDAPQ